MIVRNWAGTASCQPTEVRRPRNEADVVSAVVDAVNRGLAVKMIGSGHSFTDIAMTEGILLDPIALSGVSVAADGRSVTALAGTTLHHLNAILAARGLSLHNMGDIDRQTVAGAVSTGTHGTGGHVASLAGQIVSLRLVSGAGEVVECSMKQHPQLFQAARVGLGALGILTSITFAVEPIGVMRAQESPHRLGEVLARFDEWVEEHDHVEFFWFPHTDKCLLKRNDRVEGPAAPISRLRGLWEDEILTNGAFGASVRLGNRIPRLVPRLNAISGSALSAREFSDHPSRVFTSPRRVKFREMEYAVPRADGLSALTRIKELIDASDWRIGFPVEVRQAPAEPAYLATSSGRESLYLACHVPVSVDHRPYFHAVEQVLTQEFAGRPHWGKLHTQTADDLAARYPDWARFQAARDHLDPGRVFSNPYLDRVLGGSR